MFANPGTYLSQGPRLPRLSESNVFLPWSLLVHCELARCLALAGVELRLENLAVKNVLIEAGVRG